MSPVIGSPSSRFMVERDARLCRGGFVCPTAARRLARGASHGSTPPEQPIDPPQQAQIQLHSNGRVPGVAFGKRLLRENLALAIALPLTGLGSRGLLMFCVGKQPNPTKPPDSDPHVQWWRGDRRITAVPMPVYLLSLRTQPGACAGSAPPGSVPSRRGSRRQSLSPHVAQRTAGPP